MLDVMDDGPSPYSNHVLVEETRAGSFRAAGVSNRNGAPSYLSSPQQSDLESALEVARTWAESQAVVTVFVRRLPAG